MFTSDTKSKIGFIGAILTMISIYAASSCPIPLYALYQNLFDITKSNLSISAVFYFLGTVIALLMFGRLSDYLGRRLTIILTILLSIFGCFSFYIINNVLIFFLGRFIQGISCGMASSCVAAYLVDTSPENSSLGSILTNSATMIGLAIGVFVSGFFVELNESMASHIFIILIFVLIVCAILIYLGRESVEKKSGAIKSLKPQILVPNNVKRFLIPSSCIFIGTLAIGGFYQAFSSSMAVEQFGISNKILAATIFACLMAPQIIGSSLIDKFNVKKAQNIGMLGTVLSMVIITISLKFSFVFIFLIFSIIAAICIGLCFTASLNNLVSRVLTQERAGLLSSVYLISYGGTAIVNLFVGFIANNFSLLQLSCGYSIL